MITLSGAEYKAVSQKTIDGLVPELRKHIHWMADDLWIHSPLIVASGLGFFSAEHFNQAYARKRSIADKYLGNLRSHARRYLALVEKPYRLEAFLEIRARLTDAQYWKCLELVWTMSESLNPEIDTWIELFRSQRRYRPLLMDRKERHAFESLPDELTVYRGYQDGEYDHLFGLSWTLSKPQAAWFAHRFDHNGKPTVAKARCKRADVFCYLNGRQEQEIVVDPARLTDVQVLKRTGPSRSKNACQ